uniref:Uncharacterized protein n=1 Tax=Pararge aegeria TaxID=116150 RepID=S4P744_9NEOP
MRTVVSLDNPLSIQIFVNFQAIDPRATIQLKSLAPGIHFEIILTRGGLPNHGNISRRQITFSSVFLISTLWESNKAYLPCLKV